MIAHIQGRRGDRQRGIAMVELGLILIFTSFLLPVVFLFSRVFYHYSVIKQGTQDAANYMATLPRMETQTSSTLLLAQARAKAIVANAISEAGIKPPEGLVVNVLCNNNANCTAGVPVQRVRVFADFTLADAFWQDTGRWLPDATSDSWTFTASSEAIYQN